MTTSQQTDRCLAIYREMLTIDASGEALDVDSLNVVNVLVGVAAELKCDLYDLLDLVTEVDFVSEEAFRKFIGRLSPHVSASGEAER